MNTFFRQDTKDVYPVYEGCGNTFIIFHLKTIDDLTKLKNSPASLKKLTSVGLEKKVDSIMVISGDPKKFKKQKYHVTMEVFEPHGFKSNVKGSGWSTMCGNGIRGVAQYLYENFLEEKTYIIETRSGRQKIEKLNELWRVNMGAFTADSKYISKYVLSELPLNCPQFGIQSQKYSIKDHLDIGFNYLSKNLRDGEPHAIIWRTQNISMNKLVELTQKMGEKITSDKIFPEGINTTVAFVKEVDYEHQRIEVCAATYERNIFYVTRACGTAATVIGSLLLKKMEFLLPWRVYVHMPGGTLIIECDQNRNFFMIGPSSRVAS